MAMRIPPRVIDYLVRDPDNPFEHPVLLRDGARNAPPCAPRSPRYVGRAQRDVAARARRPPDAFTPERVSDFLDWVKERSLAVQRGLCNTMLRNDAYYFTRLGTFLERADNTARILDVKIPCAVPQDEGVGGPSLFAVAGVLRSVWPCAPITGSITTG